MAERTANTRSRTSPKGRPTPRRQSAARPSTGSGATGWVILGIAALGLVVAAFVYGPSSSSGPTGHGGTQTITP